MPKQLRSRLHDAWTSALFMWAATGIRSVWSIAFLLAFTFAAGTLFVLNIARHETCSTIVIAFDLALARSNLAVQAATTLDDTERCVIYRDRADLLRSASTNPCLIDTHRGRGTFDHEVEAVFYANLVATKCV